MKIKNLMIAVFGTDKIPMHVANSNTTFWVYANLRGNNIMIQPHKYLRVPIGFKAGIPSNWVGMAFISPRLRFEKSLELALSLIEMNESGEWAVYIYNNSDSTQILKHGEKIAQIMFFKAKECKMLPYIADEEKDFGIAGNSDET